MSFRVIYHYELHFPQHNVTALVRPFYSPNKKPSRFAALVQCFLGITALLSSSSRRTLPTRSNKRAAAASDCATIRTSRWGSLSAPTGLPNIWLDLFSFVWTGVFVYHLVLSLSLTPQSPSSEDESVVRAKATFSPKVVTHKMIKQPAFLSASSGTLCFSSEERQALCSPCERCW